MLGAVGGTPGLQELALGLPAGEQLVGSHDGSATGTLVAGKLVCGDAGGRVQETEVVVVQLDLVLDAVGEARDVLHGTLAVLLVPGYLVGEPQQAGPEAVGPFDVLDNGILQALGSGPGELGAEGIHVGIDLCDAACQAAIDLLFGERCGG